MSVLSVTPDIAQAFRLKEPQETLIPDTVLKGSADLAGVKEGGLL